MSAAGVVTFHTASGSIYAVDTEAQTIRKINGRSASDRIEAGRRYSNITDIVVGRPVWVFWGDDTPALDPDVGATHKMTNTSRVTEVHRGC